MGCRPLVGPDGKVFGFACSRGGQKAKCVECGRNADRLCDWKLSGAKKGKTCDRALCEKCAVKPRLTDGTIAKDKDLCPAHGRQWEKYRPPLPA